jgi:hypothetical protein
MRTIRIGSGAGYSGDRIEPAVERRTSEFKPFVYRSRMTAVCAQRTAGIGRVEVWRSDVRLSMSVPAPFVWRCLIISGSAVDPFLASGGLTSDEPPILRM